MNTILPIYCQIKQTIKNWIIHKEFYPGEKIPSENELAEKFSVSRLTVRQALSQLTFGQLSPTRDRDKHQ